MGHYGRLPESSNDSTDSGIATSLMQSTLKRRSLLPSLSSHRFEVKADVEPIMEEQVCSLSFVPETEQSSGQQWSGQKSPGQRTFGLESPGRRMFGQESPGRQIGQVSPRWKKTSLDESSSLLSSPGRPSKAVQEEGPTGSMFLSSLPDSLVVAEDGKKCLNVFTMQLKPSLCWVPCDRYRAQKISFLMQITSTKICYKLQRQAQ